MDKKGKRESRPNLDEMVAPGMDTEDELQEEATDSEIKKGEYTKVTQLVYDEYDHS